jgi:HlyD family secretion protein
MNFLKRFTRLKIFNRKVILLIFSLIIIIGGGLIWLFSSGIFSSNSQASAEATPSYQTSIARKGDLTISATGTGTLVAGKSVDMSFSTSGIVEELFVKAGDTVTKGTELARMNNAKNLEAQVAANELTLLQATKTLNDLESSKDVNLAQAYADMLTAQQTYDAALRKDQRKLYARCSEQVNKNNMNALEKAQARLDQIGIRYQGSPSWTDAKSVYDTALANYNYCIKFSDDEKVNFKASLDVADVTLKQAKAKYETLKASSGIDPDQLALDEANINSARIKLDISKEDLAGSTLIAPMDGKVTFLAANKGAFVDTTTYITIADITQSNVNVSINETDLSKLTLGAKANIVFDALPEETYTGEIIQVNPELSSSGQYRVATAVISLDNIAGSTLESMPLGVNAQVTILAHQVKDALLIPANAVRDLGNGQSGVFVVGLDGSLTLKIVEVGLVDSSHAEIISGLKLNDTVSTGLASGSK